MNNRIHVMTFLTISALLSPAAEAGTEKQPAVSQEQQAKLDKARKDQEDAIKYADIDFKSYMNDVQRRIKRSWFPPKGSATKRVTTLFKVIRSGQIVSVKIQQGSGVPAVDKAALDALRLASPLGQFPSGKNGSPEDLDILFTFDYNVSNRSQGVVSQGQNNQTIAASMLQESTRLFNEGFYLQAAETLEYGLSYDSPPFPLRNQLIKCYVKMATNNEFEKSVAYLNAAIELRNDPQLRSQLDAVITKNGKQPKSYEDHIEIAKMLESKAEFKGALTELKNAIALKPDIRQSLNNDVVRLGNMVLNQEKVRKWQKAVLHNSNAENHFGLGTALQTLGKNDDAIAQYKKALEINPDYAAAKAALDKLEGAAPANEN